MEKQSKNYFKFTLGLIICLLIRLIPFRVPNFEPILATQMPFSKKFGFLSAFLFGFLSIILYDSITNTVGVWTLFTAFTYGTLGLLSALYFRKRKATIKNFVLFAIFGTLFFDIITGLTVGPLIFHQSLSVAIIGQIPFTLMHLFGNIVFATTLSPAIYYFLEKKKEKIKSVSLISNPQLKLI